MQRATLHVSFGMGKRPNTRTYMYTAAHDMYKRNELCASSAMEPKTYSLRLSIMNRPSTAVVGGLNDPIKTPMIGMDGVFYQSPRPPAFRFRTILSLAAAAVARLNCDSRNCVVLSQSVVIDVRGARLRSIGESGGGNNEEFILAISLPAHTHRDGKSLLQVRVINHQACSAGITINTFSALGNAQRNTAVSAIQADSYTSVFRSSTLPETSTGICTTARAKKYGKM